MPARTLGFKGGEFGGSPTSIGERNECQLGGCSPKERIHEQAVCQ